MKYSNRGLALTKGFENCKLVAYKDGGGVWSIAYGHTQGVTAGMTCTQQQADDWLRAEIGAAERAVNSMVRVTITQGQFDALVDFAYNCGIGALHGSTLMRKLNNGDYNGAKAEFAKWNHDNGMAVAGLTRRRAAEAELFGSVP